MEELIRQYHAAQYRNNSKSSLFVSSDKNATPLLRRDWLDGTEYYMAKVH